MKLKIDVYYRNKETKSYHIFNEEITEEDISRFMEEKTKDSLPMWMNDNWEFKSVTVDKVEL